MNQGQQVTVKNILPVQWFGKTYPETLDGEVTKVFKNGKVAVRIFKLKKVLHFTVADFV